MEPYSTPSTLFLTFLIVSSIMMPGSVEDITSKDAERPQLVMSLSGHIVNKPDAAIGSNGNNGDVAAWKQTTIFGPL